MNCIEFDEQVAVLLDGVPSLTLERALRDHVSACQSCAAQLKEMQGLRTLLQKSIIPAPSDALDARVIRGFQNRNVSFATPQPWWRRLLRISGPALATSTVAVVMALLLGIGIGRVSVRRPPVSPAPAVASSATLLSPKPTNDQEVERQPLPAYTPLKSGDESHKQGSRKPANATMARIKPLESLTAVSPAGANYTTRAALDGFEPITGTRLRVIKAGEEK